MLVVNGIKLGVLDETHEVGEFERDGPARFKSGSQASCEIVHIWHMGKNVVADDEVGLLVLRCELSAKGFAEEVTLHRNAEPFSYGSRAGGWLYANAWNVSSNKIFQQVAIV